MKIAQFKNGSMACLEKTGNCYVTYARNAAGDILDKTRCDDYRSACEYYRAFQKLAKNSQSLKTTHEENNQPKGNENE